MERSGKAGGLSISAPEAKASPRGDKIQRELAVPSVENANQNPEIVPRQNKAHTALRPLQEPPVPVLPQRESFLGPQSATPENQPIHNEAPRELLVCSERLSEDFEELEGNSWGCRGGNSGRERDGREPVTPGSAYRKGAEGWR